MNKTIPWLNDLAEGYQVEFKNITSEWHMYAVQGPKSMDMVNELVEAPITDLKFFTFAENKICGEPVIINRAGYTGEKLGYEIYISSDKADFLEDKLAEVAGEYDAIEVTEFQVLAWTLPTEAGFYYMRDLRNTNPLEVGLDKGICWEKEFVGKEALQKVKENGPAREVVGFTTEESDVQIHGMNLGGPATADYVYRDGEPVGNVVKYVYSYVNEKCNGVIIAAKGKLKNGDVVQIRGVDAVICDKSFL